MDFLTFIGICAVALLLIAPIVALARSRRLRTRTDSLERENGALREELRSVVSRVYGLEKALEHLNRATERPTAGAQPTSTVSAADAFVVSPSPVERPTNIFAAKPTVTADPVAAIPAPPIKPTETSTTKPAVSEPAPRPPNFMGTATESLKPAEKRNWVDLEEKLGANWLNKIGTAAFVIGVALLLNYSMHYLGPAGKIALGYALSAILLGVGVFGERKERYRIAARAVLGGGWALAYFTTYALHNISAVRLVTNASVGFALLFAVAVAMVAHSLRYHSEITTGFAFLLAFASVAVSEIPLGALVASALLSASLVIILRARRWFVVEPPAIIATYAVHWLWLNQVYERIGGHKPFPEFAASVSLLTTYWAIYLVSYFLREEKSERESQLLTASFLLNAAGYLMLLHYQSFHPEWRFWFLLLAGAVYFGVSAWSRHVGRRVSFVLASTLGSALILAAIPYRYSGGRLEILWLVEVEALLVAGWRLLDKHLRALAGVGGAVLATYVGIHDLGPRLDTWQPPEVKLGWLLAAFAAAFFIDGELKRRLGDNRSRVDEVALPLAQVAATGFLLSAAWVALPFLWTAVAWAVAGAALIEVSVRLEDPVLRYCGHAAALFSVARLFFVNMEHGETWHKVSLRLVTVGLCGAILYVASRRHLPAPTETTTDKTLGDDFPSWIRRFGGIPAAYSGAATLLVGTVLWHEAAAAAVGLAWGIFGLALLETGRALSDRPFVVQGQLVLFASFVRIFIADLNATSRVGPFAAPVITVTLLAAMYYYVALSSEDSPRLRAAMFWLGTISVAALLRFEMPIEWVAVGWAGMAVALFALGRYLHLPAFRGQCYTMTLLVGVRCAFDNFYQLSRWHFTNTRTVTVVACSLLIYILFAAAKLKKQPFAAADAEKSDDSRRWRRIRRLWQWIEMHEQHLFFFVPTILLTILLSLEVHRGFLTAAWGVEALIVFLAVLKMDERAYRWFSLILFLLCVGRIVTVDVWNLDALGRIVSFMGLGAALLVVSFLYAKHKEMLRRVL